ncbi:MAG: hypothetical protein GY754_30120 [bacterium]|nr:hypothetical protein [bacterium]
MKALNESQIEKIMEDISIIKETLAKTRPSFQQLLLPLHFRFQALLLGISILVIGGIYQWLIMGYGSYDGIPELYRNVLWGVIVAGWLALGVLKIVFWNRSLTATSKYNSWSAMRELVTRKTLHVVGVFWTTMIFFIVYWFINEQYYFIIPTVSIGIGLFLNILGNFAEISQYTLSGSWMFLWGLVIIAVAVIPAPIAAICSFGFGCLIFSIHAYISSPQKED